MTEIVLAAWSILLELAPWLLLGAAIAGVLHGLVPEAILRRELRGTSGVVKAVLGGVPLPLCSCGVIPTAIGLRRGGASSGSTVGFLVATPQTGVDAVFVSAGVLGWPFALYKVAAALITGVTSGILVDRVVPETAGDGAAEPPQRRRDLRGMVDHALEVVRSVWLWLAIGIVVSALLSVLVPERALADLAVGSGVLAFLLVLLASLPLYVCAVASVPIAAALVEAGLPTGAAIVFLMAGPATNVATVGAVLRTLGRRALAVYLAAVIGGSIAFGMLYRPLLGDLAVAGDLGGHGHHAWWRIACGIVLLGMFVWFAIGDLRRRFAPPGPDAAPAGGGCGHCSPEHAAPATTDRAAAVE